MNEQRWARAAALCACCCALAVGAAPRELAGTVSKVTDGDSLWLQPAVQGKPIEVRLVNIDAPEICQAWGPQARDALKELVEGKQVSVRTVGTDEYQRMLATVMLDSVNVNTRLVEEGHAWSSRGRSDHGPLIKQERMAKALGRGLWREGGAVMPKDFRRANGACPH